MKLPSHITDPVMAGMDIFSGMAILGYWLDLIAHPVAALSTCLAGIWYLICIYDALSKKIKGEDDKR